MRIGITLGLVKGRSIFSNGLTQNLLSFYDLLKKITKIEKVSLINIQKISPEDYQEFTFLEGYELENWDDNVQNKFDVLICFGSTPPNQYLKQFKTVMNNKVVSYQCGNTAALQMESLLFTNSTKDEFHGKTEKFPIRDTLLFDEIWIIPQQEFHNLQILEVQHNTKVRVVPFVWSPKYIKDEIESVAEQDANIIPFLDDKIHMIEKWRVGTMEPNQNVLKNMYPIIWIFEYANLLQPELFKSFKITNALEFSKNKYLIRLVHPLSFYNQKKLALGPRWSVVNLLANECEAIVSHQWGNALNYAYFDVVYMGYPLIHNANMCQDLGYYYEDWKVKDAGKLLVDSLKDRIQDAKYTERNRNVLERYTIQNKQMIDQYELLINNLWSRNKIQEMETYNWKTNLLE